MVIAIDGPGGVGKTTVSRLVAHVLGYAHLDTGAMYRAATLAVLATDTDLDDVAAVVSVVAAANFDFSDGHTLLDGVDVSDQIRSEEVTAEVSEISAIAEVREILVARQRQWVEERQMSAVVEGRDIGTVVFPQALVKVFLTARPEVRAERRAGDPTADDRPVSEVAQDLARRDTFDSTRDVSPLRPADDAVEVDTSDVGIAEVVEQILELVAEAGADAE
ncbi:MAG: (d)CMP kinase [Acidimicrobiia bacterium]|nr:(d)CMP kinase [Acidimicrobiia bacterium]